MEKPKAPDTTKKDKDNPPLRRGQIRNRIIREFFKSIVALGRAGWTNVAGGDSGTNTPTSSGAFTSEDSSE